jgi:two-component system, OmpR family, sensor histidine kinase KdpD
VSTEQDQGRGRLKIFLGMAAGVGKTYRMLLEGHAEQQAGVDLVVGLLETHGRAETARLAEGLARLRTPLPQRLMASLPGVDVRIVADRSQRPRGETT